MAKFRNYRKSDYASVKEILQEADMYDDVWDSKDNLAGMIGRDPESVIVAHERNTVIGHLVIVPYGVKMIYLFRLVVKKNFRNKGIASQLMKYAEDIAKKRGAREIGLYVDAQNNLLHSFYTKRGFGTSRKRRTYMYMWKEVK
jgi:ribosomal protein S18 acetylase RimI-like enzyme